MITVKVVNQVLCDHSLTRFNPVSEVNAEHFTSVYGDCFISGKAPVSCPHPFPFLTQRAGFQEGGEFIAIISVKAKDSEQASKIKANAAVKFTKEHLALDAKGNFGKSKDNFLDENETTVSVTWTGGGQDLKKRASCSFVPPNNKTDQAQPPKTGPSKPCAPPPSSSPTSSPQPPPATHAILKKYTALRGFYEASGFSSLLVIPNYEQAGLYTNALHEDYLEYKALFKNLHTLALDVSAGNKTLSASPAAARLKGQEKSKAAVSSEALGSAPTPSSPYESSIVGLEKARRPSPNLPPLTITPPTSTTPIPITLEQADILTTPLPTLTQILANYHTIITCTGFALPAGTQLRLARAVLAAHVARYFPWQFGLDYPTVGAGSAQALFDEQLQVRGLLAAQSATDWTVLSTGVFMEFLVDPAAGFGVLELDDPARKVTALGGWERRVSMTATEDVGRMVAEVVFAPLGEGERTGFVAGDTLSWEGVKEVVGRVFGEGEVEGEVLGDEELERRVREGGGGLDRYRAVFGRGWGRLGRGRRR